MTSVALRPVATAASQPRLDVRDFGPLGAIDDTATFTAADIAAAAAGAALFVPAGEWFVDDWAPTVRDLSGAGEGVTVLKRKANSATTNTVALTGRSGFTISDLTIDGNKTNQTAGGNNLVLTGCWDFRLERVESQQAKAAAGNGSGIAIIGTADEANGTSSDISRCHAHHNDGMGIHEFGAISDLTTERNRVHHNGSHGISLDNVTYPVSASTIKRCAIRNNRSWSNTGTGIRVPGFVTGGSAVTPVYGHGSDCAVDIDVVGNHSWLNTAYGIVAQFTRGNVFGNTCISNGGTGSFYAGILGNADRVTIARNHCYRNEYYGIDAGASQYCDVEDNTCEENGQPSVSGSGQGINLGASIGSTAQRNRCKDNGNTSGIQINCPRYDGAGSGGIGFPWDTTDIRIIDNTVIGSQPGHVGIKVSQDVLDVEVRGNRAYGFTATNSIVIESTQHVHRHNWSDSANNAYSMSATGVLVLPDYVEDAIVNASSAVAVSSLRLHSVNVYNQAVMAVKMVARGTGYTSPPTVSFTGGAGTGATATAFITNDGQVANIRVDNPGSGYTSAPTAVLTGGGGTGATTTVVWQPWDCHNGALFNLLFAISGGFTVTISSGTRVRLAGSASYGAVDRGHIGFQGWAGALYEKHRVVI